MGNMWGGLILFDFTSAKETFGLGLAFWEDLWRFDLEACDI